jgi:hypothetical protein
MPRLRQQRPVSGSDKPEDRMRLHPAVSEQEAYDWLVTQAVAAWGAQYLEGMEAQLRTCAAAMALISATPLSDELDPLFP